MEERYRTMGNLAIRVLDYLENEDYDFFEFALACRILEMLGGPIAVPFLIKSLRDFGINQHLFDRYFMKAATDTLIKIGGEAVQPLTELLKSEHSETRKFAAYALEKIGDREVFPALEEIFNNPKEPEMVREVAGRALLRLDPEKAAKVVPAYRVKPPMEYPEADDSDLELVKKSYGSFDNLGAPSEYKPSISLYKYIEKMVYDYLDAKRRWENYIDSGELYEFVEKLDLREIIDEIIKFDKNFMLCLCGEYLQWGYIDKLSKRMWELSDDEGWHFKTYDVICVYCKNCERYAGLSRGLDDAHPDYPHFRWFYLPRLPKQSELITQEELKNKPPNWVKRLKH